MKEEPAHHKLNHNKYIIKSPVKFLATNTRTRLPLLKTIHSAKIIKLFSGILWSVLSEVSGKVLARVQEWLSLEVSGNFPKNWTASTSAQPQ